VAILVSLPIAGCTLAAGIAPVWPTPRPACCAGWSRRKAPSRSWWCPGGAYYLMTAAGIAASLGVIAATMPLLRRITGPQMARNE
jgi:hypothetical protein